MEKINGVSFKDYACASANLTAGMSVEDVAKVLEMEVPVWEDTKNQWNAKMATLSMDDMKFYGEVFMNPKQGRFAEVDSAVEKRDVLEMCPDIETYAKIFEHMSIASDFGIDGVKVLKDEYNMTLVDWTGVGHHYSQILLKSTDDMEIHEKFYMPHHRASLKWQAHFKEFYKEHSAGLTDDIDF